MTAHVPNLASIDIPRARKGEAAPVGPYQPAARDQSSGEAPGTVADLQIQAVQSPNRNAVSEEVEPRTTVSVRLTLSIQERLRLMSFHTRRSKQEIIEDALASFLTKLEKKAF